MNKFRICTRYGFHYTIVASKVQAAGGTCKVVQVEKGVASRLANRILEISLPDNSPLEVELKDKWPVIDSLREEN